MEKKKLIIIDSNSIIHRAFHALPPLTTKKGELINAVYGFLLVLFKTIRELQPDYIASTFDLPFPTFRHQKFKEYKAKRPPTPEELSRQIPKVKEILKKFNIPIFEKEGFEADDIIGTITNLISGRKESSETEVFILSGDLDSLQLVSPRTKVFALRKGLKDIIFYDEAFIKERYPGLKPEQLVDFKALRGDPSDNIPGVKGVGEKTAVELLSRLGSLENIYKLIEGETEGTEPIQPKLKEILLKNKDIAFVSKELACLERNVPIDFNLRECRWGQFDKKEAVRTLKKFEFYSLIKKLPVSGKEDKKNNEQLSF